MNFLVWVALGAGLGLIAAHLAAETITTSKVESIATGMFGAVIGGQLQVTLATAAAADGFRPATVMGAIGGGIAMLVLLAVFRKAVGPGKDMRKKRPAR